MIITGLVTEYNPLHNGHLYHIKKAREITNADGLVCIMSGNFMQRGIPAIMDKWTRASMALENGIDLVIELPVIYSLSSAEFFSYGAVSLLNGLGCVNNICFGSESGDIEAIRLIATILSDEPEEFKKLLKFNLDNRNSYARSRSSALQSYIQSCCPTEGNISEFLHSSNNILGVEYCKSLIKLNSSISPVTIKRLGSDYNNENLEGANSSATAIRKHLKESNDISELYRFLPADVYDTMKFLYDNKYDFTFEEEIFPFIKYKVFSSPAEIESLPDAAEGLHNRIIKFLEVCKSYEDLIHSVKSKRYAYTRISRLLCQYYVGFERYDTGKLRKQQCPYARILGFNSTGLSILKEMKKSTSIPLVTKLPDKLCETLQLDVQATKVYSMLNKNTPYNGDYIISPIMSNKE